MNLSQINRVHFVGIGGIGMSGLAEVVASMGPAVSGCDLRPNNVTRRLETLGIRFDHGHDPVHVEAADLVVTTAAVRQDVPELARARELGVPVIRRAELLGQLTRERRTVAVAGTHGKTTTSAMASLILREAGLDPTLIVGGVMHDLGSNAKIGAGDLLVIEADEFDRSFLQFDPKVAIVTNVETDHLDIYADLEDVVATFGQFVARVPADGTLLLCGDDANAPGIADSARCRVLLYGTGAECQLRVSEVRFDDSGSTFTLIYEGAEYRADLSVPGQHNVLNAVAAIGASISVGVPAADAVRHIGAYKGVERRFQRIGMLGGAELVDDYAHHPTEVRATIAAARGSWPSRRIIALFQPHLYSRTRDFHHEFAAALATADVARVLPIYPAREEPIPGVSSEMIVASARTAGVGDVALLDGTLEDATTTLRPMLGDGDVLLTMGAGDVHRVAEMLAEEGS